MTKLVQQFREATDKSTPLIAIRTPDPSATIGSIYEVYQDEVPILYWDIIRGLQSMNAAGATARAAVLGDKPPETLSNPAQCLKAVSGDALPEDTILFFANGHRYIGSDLQTALTVQAMANLRNDFKSKGSSLVVTCPDITFPAELAQDFHVLDEQLPGQEELERIVLSMYAAAKFKHPAPDILTKAVDAVYGLSAFAVEQVVAMSLRADGSINLEALWERKRKMIENTKGLSIWRGTESLDDVKNQDNLVGYIRKLLPGVSLVMYLDEIEKMVAGSRGDTSGVAQAMHQYLLSWMADREVIAILLIGPPGTGKSMLAKSAGNAAGAPTIIFDINGFQESLVGTSQANIRNGFKIVDAVGRGKILMLATCNSYSSLSPELRSRFLDTFFVDLPAQDAKVAMWDQYGKAFNLPKQQRPQDAGWTGREIRGCCKKASLMGVPLLEAAGFTVPISISAKEDIQGLRDQCSGRFLSASEPGLYSSEAAAVKTGTDRKFKV